MTAGRWRILVAMLWLLVMPSMAQNGDEAKATDDAAERARIEAEQVAVETRYRRDIQACYARFAVNACLDEAKARRRTQLDDRKRQSQLLKAAQLKLRGAEQTRRVERKLAQEPLPKAAVPARSREPWLPAPLPAATASAAPSEARSTSAPTDAREAAGFREREARPLHRRAQAAQLEASREQAFEARRKASEHRRELLQQRLRERTRPRASPLPDPAASALGQGSRP